MTDAIENIPPLPSSTPAFASPSHIDKALLMVKMLGAYLNRHRRMVAACTAFTVVVGGVAYVGLRRKEDETLPVKRKLPFDTPAKPLKDAKKQKGLTVQLEKWWNSDSDCPFLVPENIGDSVVLEVGADQINTRGFGTKLQKMVEGFIARFEDYALEIRINGAETEKVLDNVVKKLRAGDDGVRDADSVSVRNGKLSGGACGKLLALPDVEFADVELTSQFKTTRNTKESAATVTLEFTQAISQPQLDRWKSLAEGGQLNGPLVVRGDGVTDSFVQMLAKCRRALPLQIVDCPNVTLAPLLFDGSRDVTWVADKAKISLNTETSMLTFEGEGITNEHVETMLGNWKKRIRIIGCPDLNVKTLLNWEGEELYLTDSLTKDGMMQLLNAVQLEREKWSKADGHCGALGLTFENWQHKDQEFMDKLTEVRDEENALVWIDAWDDIFYIWQARGGDLLQKEVRSPYQSASRNARRGYPDNLRKVILQRTSKKVPKRYLSSPKKKPRFD